MIRTSISNIFDTIFDDNAEDFCSIIIETRL